MLGSFRIVGLSLVAHVVFVVALAYAMPSATPTAQATVEREPSVAPPRAFVLHALPEPVTDDEGGCSHHDPGHRGTPPAPDERTRYGIRGPLDNPDPHLARELATHDGPILENTLGTRDPARSDAHAYTVKWGRYDALGTDDKSARGRIWGDVLAEARGDGSVDVTPPHRDDDAEAIDAVVRAIFHGRLPIRSAAGF